jgi:hypothetical protein
MAPDYLRAAYRLFSSRVKIVGYLFGAGQVLPFLTHGLIHSSDDLALLLLS